MHSLVLRQLRRHLGDPEKIPEEWVAFVNAVSGTYTDGDSRHRLLERALELASHELVRRLENQKQAENERDIELKRVETLNILKVIMKKVSENYGLNEVLHSITEAAIKLIQSDLSVVFLLDENSGEYIHQASSGVPAPGKFLRIREGEGLTGKMIQTNEPAIAEMSPKNVLSAYTEWAKKYGMHSCIGFPLRREGKISGVIGCASRKQEYFQPGDIEMLGTLASHAMVAIENIKLNDEAMRSRDFFRSVVDDNANAILISNEDQKILRWNTAAEKLYGFAESEVLGRHIKFMIPKNRLSELEGDIKARTEDHPVEFITERLHKNGAVIPVSIALSPIRQDDGKILAFAATHKDLTEQKFTEEKILHVIEEAEFANNTKSEFLANMSHELRSPLNTVIGFSDLLLRDSADELTLKLAPLMKESGEYLVRLIEDLLEVDQLESGNIKLHIKDVQINSLIQAVAESRQPHLPDGFSLRLSLDSGFETIPCDPTRIRQVLTNLLDNALKYSPDSRQVTIRTQSKCGEVWISVEDEGLGMSTEETKTIFERFRQLESGYTRRSGGVGIGLNIVQNLMELHQGRIWVESEKGSGSVFTFALPKTQDTSLTPKDILDAKPKLTQRAPFDPWAGKSVLVADDAEHCHDYMRLLMASAKKVISVYNGLEAEDAALSEQPDIIIINLRMPVMDGFTAINNIKADSRTRHIPILAVTAQVKYADRIRAAESGADGFVTKPINIRNFKEEIKRICQEVKSGPKNKRLTCGQFRPVRASRLDTDIHS